MAVCSALAVLTVSFAGVSPAAARSMAVQPDGKIVVAGGISPGFGMLARLEPDGALDPSFGKGGFAVDRSSPPLVELALQPDGKVVALDAWERLRRFEADGSPDLGFGEDGVAVPTRIVEGPTAIALLADGRIALGGNFHVKMLTHQALAYVFATDGRSVEEVGKIGPAAAEENWPGNPAGALSALASRGDGSLLMAGFSSPDFNSSEGGRSVLARFVPGAGSPYDPDFGGGAGLVTVSYPGSFPSFNALVPNPAGIYAAGIAANHIVAARFSGEGKLDPGFGSGGFADVSPGPGFSRGNDLAIQPDGKVVVAGEVSSKEGWAGANCAKCSRPLLLRFLSNGALDPGFGEDGVVRLREADGDPVPVRASTVTSLPDGRALIAGGSTSGSFGTLVARVQGDGRLDPGFGEGGIATVDACPGRLAVQQGSGCLPSARARLHVRRAPGNRIALRLKVRPNLDWARVRGVSLTLPDRLQVVDERRRRIRATLVEEDGERRTTRVAVDGRELSGNWSIGPRSVSLRVPATAMRWVGGVAGGRRLPFRVRVAFGTRFFEYPDAGAHEVVLRRALG